MTSRGNDLSSAAADLFVLKGVMQVWDDACSVSVQSVCEEGRDGDSKEILERKMEHNQIYMSDTAS